MDNITLELGDALDGSKILYLRDTESGIDTSHRIDYMRVEAARYSMVSFLQDELSEWVKDFCKFAYTDEAYVFRLVLQALSKAPRAKPTYEPGNSCAWGSGPRIPKPEEPKKVKPKKVKRAKLPVARVVKL